MIDPASALAFLALSLVIIVVPGPGVLFVVGRALVLGTRGALISVLGNAAGVAVQIVVVAAGLGVVIARSEVLFTAMKIGGALVLVWLGIQSIRHRNAISADEASAVSGRTRTLVRDSVIVGLTNAKTIVFFVAALPQAANPSIGSPTVQMLMLGAAFLVIGIACDSLWAIAAGSARDWFATNAARIAVVRAGGGAALVALGLGMGLSAGL
ncbi:LysE family translocator [Microcella alkaliphila]|uniref:Lysine exporter protein n=1 Tax=Microcella alkaliphila TaxID=279828 RepID=A0A0U4WZG5_9MICO|nr:LysE family translocator [Microcella alkaliphila]BAU33063.1 Lysine exporter protein [Microcella alkaliphila]